MLRLQARWHLQTHFDGEKVAITLEADTLVDRLHGTIVEIGGGWRRRLVRLLLLEDGHRARSRERVVALAQTQTAAAQAAKRSRVVDAFARSSRAPACNRIAEFIEQQQQRSFATHTSARRRARAAQNTRHCN